MKIFNRWRYGKYINSEMLIKWLEDQINREVENEKGRINYGRLEENYIHDENKKQWELGRNRMIEKVINAIKYGEDYMKY